MHHLRANLALKRDSQNATHCLPLSSTLGPNGGTTMRGSIVSLLTALAFLPAVALGGEESARLMEKHEKCGELSSEPKIEGCFFQVNEESNQYLNKEYGELVSYLNGLEDKRHKKRLIDSQRLWIKFRDSDCKFYSDGQPIRTNICLSEKTIQRLKELEKYNTSFAMGCNGCPW